MRNSSVERRYWRPWDWMKSHKGEQVRQGLTPGARRHLDDIEEEDPAHETREIAATAVRRKTEECGVPKGRRWRECLTRRGEWPTKRPSNKLRKVTLYWTI